ncbi:hypothetical protein KDJ56_16995 [Brevibacillus composti]|uniref:Uncharacterized protein n=1 Tax=Brevibacillus composti TaxID=2796470 RepID=A0A7T5EJ39_9BACL|nr:hypothetical protein [Brevibacillus composti]QQE73582.1 hypothetical protein JD108_17050 [Brevibacillus composti]QUO40664.1 hypothetical protein KDJ56_16995 [Brevibacillus composti]
MPMWAFLLTIVGGLMTFAVIYDQVKKRKKTIPKELSSSQIMYTETYLNEVRNDINNPHI